MFRQTTRAREAAACSTTVAMIPVTMAHASTASMTTHATARLATRAETVMSVPRDICAQADCA